MSKKQELQKKKLRSKNKRIYLFLLLLGNVCLIASLFIYSITVISPWILVIICLFCGFIGVIFDYKRYMFTYDVDGFLGYFSVYGQNALFIGGLTCLLFLGSNYYFAQSEIVSKEYKIIERRVYKPSGSSTYGKKKPLFTVEFNGKRKELTFVHKYLDNMNEFKTISLDYRKGFVGFDVILDKRLNK